MAIERFGKAKEQWFTDQLNLDHGIPSHDTLGDVFASVLLPIVRRSIRNNYKESRHY